MSDIEAARDRAVQANPALPYFDTGPKSSLGLNNGPLVIDLSSTPWHAGAMKKRTLDSINVQGIPQPVARGLEVIVHMLRDQLPRGRARRHAKPPVKHGTVIGSLSRRDIYDDVV